MSNIIEFARDREILARLEGKAGAITNDFYIVSDSTNFPDGFPRGLAVVKTTVGGEAGFIKSYLDLDIVVEDVQDAWNEQVVSGVTNSVVTDPTLNRVVAKVSSDGSLAAAGVLASEVVAIDMSSSEFLILKIKSSVAVDSGDLQILTDATADCASPDITADVPRLQANEWTLVQIPVTGGDATTISVGIKQASDLGAIDIEIDVIRSFVAGSSACIGFLKDPISFSTDLNMNLNINGESGIRTTSLISGEVFLFNTNNPIFGVIGADAGAIADLSGKKIENDTVLKF